ncbi:MAG: PEP-utilizing enzyme [Firmicutes bacterium]|nr:PEP-utilizing enzyme [Bacillota bacterium]
MKIFNLGKIDSSHFSEAGGKACGLDKLIKNGYDVPSGFVILDMDTDSNDNLNSVLEYYNNLGLNNVAVRSSATAEDGNDFSFAGQFKTFLNIKNQEQLKKAIIDCIASLDEDIGASYTERFAKNVNIKMSVVVQEMVDADFAGVCFSVSPSCNNSLLIEAVEGLGEQLVSGEKAARQYLISHESIKNIDNNFESINDEDIKMLSSNMIKEIACQAMKMQSDFGMPLDTEWAIKDGKLFWLQARPITVNIQCADDEFDPKDGMDNHIITRCNIGEMLPEAITPLTMSVSLYAIDWGLREMLRIAGAIKTVDELPPFSCALSIKGHLFMNLGTLYRLEKKAFLTKADNINLSICGRSLDDVGEIPGKKAGFFRKINNTRKYLMFVLSRNKARLRLAKLASEFKIEPLDDDAKEIYAAIDKQKKIAGLVAHLHYATSAHSGAMSSAIIQIVNKKFDDMEKSKAVLAELLSGIGNIESVDILAQLKKIARTALEENPKVYQMSTDELDKFLENAGQEVQKVQSEFFMRHGHRAIREAELRSKGWADDRKAFVEYLKTVIVGGAEDVPMADLSTEDLKAKIKALRFRGLKKRILVYLAKQARNGVRNREFSKSKLIQVLDVFKKAYVKLAHLLTKVGKLPDEDAIFFLTHEEIKTIVFENSDGLIKKALQRRRLLKEQTALKFGEIYLGKPQPLPSPDMTAIGDIIKGTAISKGIATGPARVVKNAQDAMKLEKGEIMVAAYTDIGFSPYYCLVEALVTEIGSALSHGAVVAREYALPLVSNVLGATEIIKTGDIITVDGTHGNVIRVK